MEFLTIREFAEAVKYQEQSIRNKVWKKEIKSQLIGKKRLIPKSELEKWLRGE